MGDDTLVTKLTSRCDAQPRCDGNPPAVQLTDVHCGAVVRCSQTPGSDQRVRRPRSGDGDRGQGEVAHPKPEAQQWQVTKANKAHGGTGTHRDREPGKRGRQRASSTNCQPHTKGGGHTSHAPGIQLWAPPVCSCEAYWSLTETLPRPQPCPNPSTLPSPQPCALGHPVLL